MDKLKLHTTDFTQENIARLAELFPNCVTEAQADDGSITRAIDFDQLRQELSDHVVDGPRERYQLNWPGKREALLAANAPIAKTLRPCREESVDFDTTKNLFIEGDNLDALKLLQETYLNKVKMIYIDPPYNTGNDFVYEDDFSASTAEYFERSQQVDDAGARLVANTESNGRFHSDWLSMIYSRLKLARNMLTNDGAIFISIDDSEMENLKRLASEVFGETNFIGTMIWAAGRKNDSKYISASHEYIVCYARNLAVLKERGITWKVKKKGLDAILAQYAKLRQTHGSNHTAVEQGLREWYASLPDSDPSKRHKHYSSVDSRGVYFPSDLRKPAPTSRSRYDILHPVTKKPVNMHPNGWSFAPERMEVLLAEDRIKFGPDEKTRPTLKVYIEEANEEAAYSVFYQDGRASSKRLNTLLGGEIFDFPKDEFVIKSLIEMATSESDIILDFFAGSSTTAHAVMALNAEDAGKRSFIMVQLPEPTPEDSEARKAGYETIAEISKERIRRAGKKVKEESGLQGQNLDIGFRVLKADASNMKDVYYKPDAVKKNELFDHIENIKEDRSPEDLLFQVMLDWGTDLLTSPISAEMIDGKTVFFVDQNALAACFDTGVTEELVKKIAARKPLRAVFRDSGFGSDAVKINVEQIFKLISPGTEVKAI